MRRLVVIVGVFALAVTACTAGKTSSGPESINPSASHAPVTLQMWSEWTSPRETKTFNKIFDLFQQQYPWITVDSKTGLTDQKIIASINAGDAPDTVLSFGVDNVGKFCQSGAWIDLNKYINDPNVGFDLKATIPSAALTYTAYNGIQCSLPFETDATGLYYNLDMFKNAGISSPPKTTDELIADAKKLTQFNADGSIKVAGFVPWLGYNCCGNTSLSFGHMFGASWLDAQGDPAFSSDPQWAAMFEWQKRFITDVYGKGNFANGSDALQRFVAGSADEFSASNDFEIGRVAMTLDGEWRPAFVADEHPELNYDSAPMPVAPDQPDLYGSGIVGGTVIGIPRGSAHEAEAWLLIKYMATDTSPIVHIANFANNVPTTFEALKSPDLNLPPQFQTFMDVFNNPHSEYRPTTPIGEGLATYLDNFADKWQTGSTSDLQGGLAEVAQNTKTSLEQAQGP
jgi:multiple sugar transport system substrate-binding protein